MEKGIVTLSVVNLRNEPSNASELEDQLLFGEMYVIVDRDGEWLYICKDSDGYCGWINSKQHFEISDEEFIKLKTKTVSYQSDNIAGLAPIDADGIYWLSKCSIIRGLENGRVTIGNTEYEMYGNVYDLDSSADGYSVVAVAMDFLNVPYLWGGKTIMGIDCSGLVQLAYMANGICLPRNASQQAIFGGDMISFIEESTAGDLAFFGDEDKISHVGIITGDGRIIHASGKVRIDIIDHEGIYNTEKRCYTHKLRLIKRLVS